MIIEGIKGIIQLGLWLFFMYGMVKICEEADK